MRKVVILGQLLGIGNMLGSPEEDEPSEGSEEDCGYKEKQFRQFPERMQISNFKCNEAV